MSLFGAIEEVDGMIEKSLLPREYQSFPNHWKVLRFTDAFKDKTGGQIKIKKKDYLNRGVLPVIDQGQEFYGGFVNDLDSACEIDLPCILFGDHTKIFKYVEDPFALGADGVKVLQERGDINPKFAYYYLITLKLPNVGYSRHFKFLKRAFFPLPPIDEQRRIAAILDQADVIRRKRQQAIALTDELLRSTFLEMFGDPVINPKGWEVALIDDISEVQGGLQVTSKRKNNPLEMPYLRVANVYRDRLVLDEIKTIRVTEQELKRTTLQIGDLLIVEGNGNAGEIGRSSIWDGSISPCLHQNHLIRVRLNFNKAKPIYISAFLNSAGGRRQLNRFGKTTSGLNTISTSNVKATEVLLPPLVEQNKYIEVKKKVEKYLEKYQKHYQQLDDLFNSLLQRAFKGQL